MAAGLLLLSLLAKDNLSASREKFSLCSIWGGVILHDRVVRGFLAGIIASVPGFTLSQIAIHFKWTAYRWLDFTAVFIYGHLPESLGEQIFAAIVTILFVGLLAILFSFLVPKISSNYLELKSWLYAIAVWFCSLSVITLFKIPLIEQAPLRSAIMNFILASVWGLIFGYVLRWLDARSKV